MIVCFCTSKTEDEVKDMIVQVVGDKKEFDEALVKEVHQKLNGGDESMGRCFGCYDEVEELVFEYVRKGF